MNQFKLRSIVSIAALSASAMMMSACGTQNQLYNNKNSFEGTYGSQNDIASTVEQKCSSMPNVSGQGFFNSVDRQYRACKGTVVGSSASNIALFPADHANKQICVFPVQQVNGRPSVFVVNPYAAPSGRYAVQCASVTGTGSLLTFTNFNLQGAYVVNYNDASVFANCLATGDVASCAANNNIGYSLGYWQ